MRPVASTDADGTVWWREKHVSADFYTSDQLRQAKVEVLREAAARFTGRGSEHTSTAVELELRSMADEIERSKT
jgi:hypothetical protein